jgi:hypothetical protein
MLTVVGCGKICPEKNRKRRKARPPSPLQITRRLRAETTRAKRERAWTFKGDE